MAFAILAAMSLCGQLNKSTQDQPPANVSQAKPTPDKESVKAELLKIEERLLQAAVDGDISELSKSTTDDFKLTGIDGKVQTKNEALAEVKKEKYIKNFSITDPDLQSFSEDSAVLAYTVNITAKNGRSASARTTHSFVKKDGNWLIRSEQTSLIRK